MHVVRYLDRAEAFFWFLDRSSSMNFAVWAEGSGTLDRAALQRALDAAQVRHPMLRVAVQADAEQRLCFVEPRPAATIAVELVRKSDWRGTLVASMVELFALGQAPLMRAQLHASPDGDWVLALIFHHSIADARSAFSLLSELLLDCATGPQARTRYAAPDSLLQLYPDRYAGAAGLAQSAELRAQRAAQPQVAVNQAQFQADSVGLEPCLVSLSLAAEPFAKLRAHAKQAGCTISGLIGATQMLALRELFGDEQTHALGLTFPADLRPHLQTPVSAEALGLYITLITCVQPVGPQTELWELARKLSTALQQQMASGAAHLFYNFIPRAESIAATDDGIAGFAQRMARAPQTSLLSNAGSLPALPELPGLKVHARSFALCPSRTQSLFSAVSSDERGLTINLNHNAAQFSRAAAAQVAMRMQQLLLEAAG